MPSELIKREKLQLVQIEKREFPDKQDSTKTVVQYRHLFLDPLSNPVIGWRENDKFDIHCKPSGQYEEQNALLWAWSGREWLGKMKYTLSGIDPTPVKR